MTSSMEMNIGSHARDRVGKNYIRDGSTSNENNNAPNGACLVRMSVSVVSALALEAFCNYNTYLYNAQYAE